MLPMHPDHMLKMFHAEQDHLHAAVAARRTPEHGSRSLAARDTPKSSRRANPSSHILPGRRRNPSSHTEPRRPSASGAGVITTHAGVVTTD